MSNWFNFYERYGVNFSSVSGDEESGYNGKTVCFKCKSNKLFIDSEKGLFVCKVCKHSGNNLTFIRDLHKEYSERKSNPLIKKFSEIKNIHISHLKNHGVVQSSTEVFIPIFGPKKEIVALRPYDFNSNKILGVSGQKIQPNFWLVGKHSDPYYLFEADLDAIAFSIMAKKVGRRCNIISFPGTGFNKNWVSHLKGKKTIWCFDHDKLKGPEGHKFYPGEEGIKNACKILDGRTSNFKWLNWSLKDYPRPFDVRDLYIANKKQSKKFFKKIDEITEDFSKEVDNKPRNTDSVVVPLEVNSFDNLCAEFSKSIQFNPTLRRTLAVSVATVLSAKTQGDAIWMFIVGPASSGKTTILDAFNACTGQTIHRSTLTKTSLISGRNIDEDSDPSILPRLDSKCLVIKDLTMLLTANAGAQEETFGTLRDAYDASISVQYGNGVIREYSNLRFSWLSGVTDIIQSFNKSDAGERFLRVDIVDPNFDEGLQIRKALKNLSKDNYSDHLRAATLGFIQFMWGQDYEKRLPDLSDSDIDKLEGIAQVIAYMRTKVKKGRDGDVEYRVRKEVGTRVAKQLGKLIQMLCVTFQKDSLSEDEFNDYILKVAIDTCTSIQTEITMQLMKFYKSTKGCTVEMLADKLQLGKSTISGHLPNMQEVGFVEYSKRDNMSGARGRNLMLWKPTNKFTKLWNQSGLNNFEYTINANTIDQIKKKRNKDAKTFKIKNDSGRIRRRQSSNRERNEP